MVATSAPDPLRIQNRRYLMVLLLATILVRGVMYFSYPLPTPGRDDNQSAPVYMMYEVASGNMLVGNIRYNTGYPFIMSPFKWLTRLLGPQHERIFLLIQITAYSTIPIMVYDMMRRRFDGRTAIVTALVVMLDPFGLQWAHLHLPAWLIATLIVFALWIAQLSWSSSMRARLSLVAVASVALSLATLARLNLRRRWRCTA